VRRVRARGVAALVVTVALVLATGCGGDDGGDDALTEQASSILQDEVANARLAYSEGDPDRAVQQLVSTRGRVDTFEQEGQVQPDRATDIRAAIDDLIVAINTSTTTTSSSTTSTTEPPDTEPPPTEPSTTVTTTTTTEPPTTAPPTTTEPPTTTVPPDGGGDGGDDGDDG
jgi:hypothetical protein